ncbi:MAG: hypothetical protein ACR2P8_07805 [Myxococcota bacterium]
MSNDFNEIPEHPGVTGTAGERPGAPLPGWGSFSAVMVALARGSSGIGCSRLGAAGLGLLAVLVGLLVGQGAGAAPFEPEIFAREGLSPELREGPHHRVSEDVRVEGLTPVYTVESEFGSFEARGEQGVRQRVQEIAALAKLRDAQATSRAPVPQLPQQPYGSAWPGAGGSQPVELPDPNRARVRFADLDAMKRAVAHELSIDPYSDNAALQQELQSHVWAGWNGGLNSPFVPSAEEEEERPSERAAGLVRDYAAEELEQLNRLELAAMGVDEELRERFLAHPAYTPNEAARLVDALSELESTEDREAFIAAAADAPSPQEARRFQRLAELMRRYQDQTGDLQRFVAVEGRIAATTSDGTLLVPVVADHAVWNAPVAAFAESVARATGSDPELGRARVLVSGTLSERARTEMQGLGIDVTERALEAATPPPDGDAPEEATAPPDGSAPEDVTPSPDAEAATP